MSSFKIWRCDATGRIADRDPSWWNHGQGYTQCENYVWEGTFTFLNPNTGKVSGSLFGDDGHSYHIMDKEKRQLYLAHAGPSYTGKWTWAKSGRRFGVKYLGPGSSQYKFTDDAIKLAQAVLAGEYAATKALVDKLLEEMAK
jgi:hypothetical protein